MKKLVLILSAIVVLVAFAVPVFAMEMYDPEQRLAKLYDEKASVLKVSGEFTFGMITPVGDSDNASIGFANAYLGFSIWPDEYNSVYVELVAARQFNQRFGLGGTPEIGYWELTSDLGSYFGLPIGFKNVLGVTSLYTNKYEVTGHAWERIKIRTAIDPLWWKIFGDFGVVQTTVGIGFGETTNWASNPGYDGTNDRPWGTGTGDRQGQYNDFGFYAFLPNVVMAEWEFWYLAQDNPDLRGNIGLSVKWDGLAGGLLGIAGGFVYNIQSGSAPGYAWSGFGYRDPSSLSADSNYYAWGAGISIDYMGAALGVAANGDVLDAFDQLAIDLDYAFGDFGVYGTLAFTFAQNRVPASKNYLGTELGFYTKVGGAKWTIGYLIDGAHDDGYNYGYSVADIIWARKGGLFVIGDIDF